MWWPMKHLRALIVNSKNKIEKAQETKITFVFPIVIWAAICLKVLGWDLDGHENEAKLNELEVRFHGLI